MQPATELIREIALLEFEVGHLEQYLLALYRKAFDQDQQTSSLSPSKKVEGLHSPLTTPRRRRLDFANTTSANKNVAPEAEAQMLSNSRTDAGGPSNDQLPDSGVQRSQSALYQHSAVVNRSSPSEEDVGKVRACHSQPLSMMEVSEAYLLAL